MIAYVNGILEDLSAETAVLDVGGIGYNVNISSGTLSRLPGIGEPVKLYTYTSVREDAIQLYGFLSKNELELFKLLITVSGIGPKGALAILSVMDVDDLRFAISSGDSKAIAKAPGVGPKTAQRVILDLKDKISMDDTLISMEAGAYAASLQENANSSEGAEAIEALVALGYGRTESAKAVGAIPNLDQLDSGIILKEALKRLF